MEDFKGFRYGNIHSKDLHLTVVSSGDRFNKNVLPSQNNYTADVPGGNGNYYFGQTFGNREFTINVSFEDIDEITWRRISQIFSNDKLQDLVFDENPYKTYRAKVSQKPDFKFVCFRDKITGERIYKGEGTLNFVCYHPLAFCFNKYIVRAADFYNVVEPKEIIEKSFETDFDKTVERSKDIVQPKKKYFYSEIVKHFNTKDNMKTPWKGGYPTIEQVQRGELYFKKDGETKTIIDVRGYWDNVPLWAKASKLLTTPTLDFDQELIYCPQYSRYRYYNMDTGLNKANYALGSRLLVYNPGDVPIDFELKLGNLTQQFRGSDDAMFRISRYNVQRLTIEQVVDWLKLEPRPDVKNPGSWKYGAKYFATIEKSENQNQLEPEINELYLNHPNHCYIVEPIPQEKLSHFIKLFYWQSNLLFNERINTTVWDEQFEFYPDNIKQDINRHIINHEKGEMYAERYEELRNQCITDDEKNELYWITLKEAILDRYDDVDTMLKKKYPRNSEFWLFDKDYSYEDFLYDFILNPLEYIRYDNSLDYGEFNFNISRFPQFMTFDYFDISNKNFDKIPYAHCGCNTTIYNENSHREQVLPLILDSERRMLYNNNEPEWQNRQQFLDTYPEKADNFYNYKGTKTIWNDNIVRGHWFQLPPGWSMIDISPLVDEDNWGGKRWLDARPFDWGDDEVNTGTIYNPSSYRPEKVLYEKIYKALGQQYAKLSPMKPSEVDITENNFEDYIQFRRWYEGWAPEMNDELYHKRYQYEKKYESEQRELLLLFKQEMLQYRRNKIELQFLKDIAEWWRINKPDGNDIDDWWWWANHYIWANFPPIYWGYADLLNKAEIKYIPQYY